jgi:hypothetical protein
MPDLCETDTLFQNDYDLSVRNTLKSYKNAQLFVSRNVNKQIRSYESELLATIDQSNS